MPRLIGVYLTCFFWGFFCRFEEGFLVSLSVVLLISFGHMVFQDVMVDKLSEYLNHVSTPLAD